VLLAGELVRKGIRRSRFHGNSIFKDLVGRSGTNFCPAPPLKNQATGPSRRAQVAVVLQTARNHQLPLADTPFLVRRCLAAGEHGRNDVDWDPGGADHLDDRGAKAGGVDDERGPAAQIGGAGPRRRRSVVFRRSMTASAE